MRSLCGTGPRPIPFCRGGASFARRLGIQHWPSIRGSAHSPWGFPRSGGTSSVLPRSILGGIPAQALRIEADSQFQAHPPQGDPAFHAYGVRPHGGFDLRRSAVAALHRRCTPQLEPAAHLHEFPPAWAAPAQVFAMFEDSAMPHFILAACSSRLSRHSSSMPCSFRRSLRAIRHFHGVRSGCWLAVSTALHRRCGPSLSLRRIFTSFRQHGPHLWYSRMVDLDSAMPALHPRRRQFELEPHAGMSLATHSSHLQAFLASAWIW